ncbi:hypothetical protein, partial [Escherichia coli]|uniref:hypothetical protein n=1 Tax=Escherichia coli TaxID=562 RepID=UPI001F493B6C
TDFGGKTSIFSHPVYLFLREFSLQDFRGGSIPGIKAALDNPGTTFKGYVIHEDAPVTEITLYMESLTAEEREIIKAGSLINFNKNRQM